MDAGSVTAAAERLHLTQPAISKLLAGFEIAVGMRLFDRSKRRLIPTVEARMLMHEIDRIFGEINRFSRFAADVRNLQAGELTIASVTALGQRHVPRVIANFVRERSSVHVGLHLRSSYEVAEWTASNKVDLGITMMPVDHPSIRNEVLSEVQAVCALPLGHRLNDKRWIEPADLANENFISFMKNGRLRHVIDGVFEDARVVRQLRLDAFSSDSACAFVSAGVGVSIVEPYTASEYLSHGELVLKPFRPAINYQFLLLYPAFREPSLLAVAFAKQLRTFLTRLKLPVATTPDRKRTLVLR